MTIFTHKGYRIETYHAGVAYYIIEILKEGERVATLQAHVENDTTLDPVRFAKEFIDLVFGKDGK